MEKRRKLFKYKKLLLPYIIVKLSKKSLVMITHFLQMSVNEIMIVLCQNMLQNIGKIQSRSKEFYIKTTSSKN